MELLLIFAFIVHFIGLILVMRFFFKQLSNKVAFTSPETSEQPSAPVQPPVSNNPLFRASATRPLPNDPASPNQIAEDANDFEINEQNISGLPNDVKFAVEGGDTNTPPGFEETNAKR